MNDMMRLNNMVDRVRMAAILGDIKTIRSTLVELATVDPTVVLLAHGCVLLDQGRSSEAEVILSSATNWPRPVHRLALVMRCQALIECGRAKLAVNLLQDALRETGSASPDMLASLARGWLHLDDLDSCQSILEALFDVVPNHFQTRYGLGVLRLQQGRVEEAIAHLSAAQSISPIRVEPYQALSRAWRVMGFPREGSEKLEALLENQELMSCPALCRELVELYAAVPDGAGLAKWLRRLEESSQLRASHRLELARHWRDLGCAGELRRLMVGLGEDAHEASVAHLIAGLAAEVDGELSRALDYYRSALRIHPHHWFVWERLGRTLLAVGGGSKLVNYVQQAQSLAPDMPEVRLLLGLFKIHTGDASGASRALKPLAAHHGIRWSVRHAAQAALKRLP